MTRLLPRLLQLTLAFAACVAAGAQEPTPAAPPNLDGHVLFTEKGCAHCHGPEGAGTDDGPTLRGLARRMPSDAMRHQIIEGGKSMPAFGDALTPEETDALISWLRTLKPAPKPRPRQSER